MAKAHVLDTINGLTRVVFHIDVPSTNNSVGTSWASVLLNSGIGGKTILADGNGSSGTVSVAEKAMITNGTVYEVEDRLRIPSGMNMAAANAFFDGLHAAKTAEIQAEILARLNLFGFTRS
jgi:hypothetical protein